MINIDLTDGSNSAQIDQVLEYRRQGWWIVDAGLGSKVPNTATGGWQNQRYNEHQLKERFATRQNVSLLLGIEPFIIVDVDLDTPEATKLGFRYLPRTYAMFGRQGRGLSHFLYQLDHTPKTMAWKVAGRKIIELRSRGHQTIIPNSVHPSGADIRWVGADLRPQTDFNARPGPVGKVEFDELIDAIDYIAAVSTLAEVWTHGTRHDAAFCVAGGLARAGYDREKAIQFVHDVCEVAGDEDEAANQERSLAVHDTYNKWESGDRQLRGWPSLEEMIAGNGRAIVTAIRGWLHLSAFRSDGKIPALNDHGNADRFVEAHSQDLRYNEDIGEWLAWEGTRWKSGRNSTALHLAETIGPLIQKDAVEESDPKFQQDLWKFGLESGNAHRLRNMVSIAQTRPEVIVHSEDLDTDPADVNFINFTFNLETMSHRPHRAEDLITRLCPVKYDPLARPDARWEKFLDEVTRGDKEFRRYLQKAAGLTMSGFTDEEVVFITHGPAGTGKTTFLETLRAVLGDYAATASPEAFLAGRNISSGSARPDLVKLVGKRFVTAVEIDEGRQLAHSVVKMMTGGDTVAVRQLYQKEIEFKPVCKIWIATNHDPGIRSNDSGMWRRVHVLNFHNRVPDEEQDRTLKSYLTNVDNAGPAIANWMIEGYRLYKREGLRKPEVVKRAIEEYRNTQDFMFDFFAANCVFDRNEFTMGNDLMTRYNEWAAKTGNPRLATNVLAARFREEGLIDTRTANGKRWMGVKLLSYGEVHPLVNVDLSDEKTA